jgi:hypothetical protein
MTSMSPYAATKLVNAWIADLGVDKKLPPQMLYTYVKKNYIPSVEVDGKKQVTEVDLKTWFETKYAVKNLGRPATETVEVDENQLELELQS